MDETERLPSREDIARIHEGTAIYTCQPEIEALLATTGWPACGGRLLDPGCGDGNMIVAALKTLAPAPADFATVRRVHGCDFHEQSVQEARQRLEDVLLSLGWKGDDALVAAREAVEVRDYIIDQPTERWQVILANPPYWRRSNLPVTYRDAFDGALPRHARGDLLHGYLHNMLGNLAPGGVMALITSDRWLLNSGTSDLRREIGQQLCVAGVQRLDARSAFHRPKERVKGAPPRVHAVAITLATEGRPLGQEPLRMEEVPEVDGVPFSDLVELRLAPWLGTDNIFTVDADAGLPAEHLVPCILPRDLCPRTDRIGPTRRWAIVTGDEEPPKQILEHLDRNLHRMPVRGRRRVRWLPPERFDGHLPLPQDAVLVPRLAPRLRAIRLPANHLPTNHSLVVASGLPVERIQLMLNDPRVQAQADALALRVEGGYRSYTATLLRQLIIPNDLIEPERKAA